MAKKKKPETGNLIAENRKARFNYEILDTLECGIQLVGSEIKALRTGKANIAESYAAVDRQNELILYNAHIQEYVQANRFNHQPKRPRKLLAHCKQIDNLRASVEKEGMTLVPLRLYFNERGRAKLLLGLARGKKIHDKRESEKKRDWQREKARLLRERN